MKVYRALLDVNNYQSFLFTNNDDLNNRNLRVFDAMPKSDTWVPPSVYIERPKLKKGNFFDFWSTASLVVDETTSEKLEPLLELSGELLPLPHENAMYYVLNVTECINALDRQETKWQYEPDTIPIEHYVFHPDRLFCGSSLFKIPETCNYEILTVEGIKDPDDEFKGRVERLKLKGLIFQELWSDE